MVGGIVINIVICDDGAWVQCEDTTHYYKGGRRNRSFTDTCAIRVKDAKAMKVGDRLWWQSCYAFWTPQPFDGREDIQLDRIGYSHSTIPDDVMAKITNM